MPLVSVIVPARDAAVTVGRTLDALAAQDFGDREVVVVDDGSTDETTTVAGDRPGVHLVCQHPQGPAAARNRGVAESSGALLAFTDADCFPDPGWLSAGVRALERWELVQGRVTPDPGAAIGPFDRTIWVIGESGLYESANLLMRRTTFEQLGGFEEWLAQDTGKAMGEDVWLGWRARRAGLATGFGSDAVVHHAVFARSAADYLAERLRLRHFPALARRIPELRSERFFMRLFLTRRSAAFAAALVGATAAAVGRSGLPLLAALPYAAAVARHAWTGPGPAAVEVAADAVSFAALAVGSAEQRSVLL